MVGTALGYAVLTLLKRVEDFLPVDRHATVHLVVDGEGPGAADLAGGLTREGFRIVDGGESLDSQTRRRHIIYEVHWRAAPRSRAPTGWFDDLARHPGVVELAWNAGSAAEGEAHPPIS